MQILHLLLQIKRLTLGENGDQFGSCFIHLRNRTAENGMVIQTTGSVALTDITYRMSNGIRRAIRLEGRGSNGNIGANKLGRSGSSFPQLCIGDTRAAISSKVPPGKFTEYSDRLVVNGNIQASGYNSLSDISLNDEVGNVSEIECVGMLNHVKAKTYIRKDLYDQTTKLDLLSTISHNMLLLCLRHSF